MASAQSPTPMPSGYDHTARPALHRMPPARPNLRRTSPLSNSIKASEPIARSRSNNSINDSSDDEASIPKLSAEAEELLGVRTGERPAGKGIAANASQWARYREGSPVGKDDYKASSILGRERTVSPAAHKSGSPRVVRLSAGGSGSGRLRRAVSVASTYEGSPLSGRGTQDMKTPAPRPKSTLGGSSAGTNAGDYSAKASSGETAPMGASAVYRNRGEETGMHNSLRVKRIGKVSGSFLSGPARRGMIRRPSEEDQVPYATGDDKPTSDNNAEEDKNEYPDFDRYQFRSSPLNDPAKTSQKVRFANGSAPSPQDNLREIGKSPVDSARRNSRNAEGSAETSASKPSIPTGPVNHQLRPVVKAIDVPPMHNKENAPPPTFKRDKPGLEILALAEKPRQQNHVSKVQLHSSPSRKPLAGKSGNTPLPLRAAPAPPPPKMSVLETATATAGSASAAQSKRKSRNLISVNGKQFTRMECIGRGGSGRVYRVMAENFKLFAVKSVSLEDLDELTIRGFKGEIELLRRLENVDRVVRLYDFEINEEKKSLRVLMDIGELDLKKILDPRLDEETGKFDITFTRYIWKEMLECVAAVHAFDIVHSDLKPANFVLMQGRLKLIDFGIANAIQDDTVNVHREQQVGTPNYMSPETLVDTNAGRRASDAAAQAEQQQPPRPQKLMKVGKPSDVWSLGCILYQIVYGKPPFGHIQNNVRKVMAITNPSHAISFPATGLGKVPVPTGLIRTLRKCLDRDASRRPTVEQLLGQADLFLHPDAPGTVPVSQELIGRLARNIVAHVQDHGVPSEEELSGWPGSFFNSIRAAVEEGRA